MRQKKNKKKIYESLLKYKLKANLILEEIGRNTTAAIIFGLKLAIEINKDAFVVLMPSDHYISDNLKFKDSVLNIVESKQKYNWYLFGIKPNHPSTGYGYIKANGKDKIKKVEAFIEKPNIKKAKELLISKNIYWNSGIFIGQSSKLIYSIKEKSNNIYINSEKAWQNREISKNDEYILKKSYLKNIKSESIDKSVLEVEKSKAMSILGTEWSDIGSWDTVSDLTFFNNSQGKKLEINSKNNYNFSKNKNVIFVGVNNLIVVNYKNKILVLKKGESEKLKNLE